MPGSFPILSWRRWAVAGPVAAVLVVCATLSAANPDLGELLGPAGMVLGMTTAGIMMLIRSHRLATRERRAWRIIASGALFAAAGVLVTGTLVASGVTVPAFGLLDVFFVGTYLAIVVAIALLARSEADGRDWSLTLFDALIGGVALVALLWSAFEERLMASLDRAPMWEWIVALVYPVIDVIAIVALMILVMRRSTYRWDVRLLFLALTLLFQFAADLLYLESGLGNSFQNAEPAFHFFILSSTCALLAAALVDRTPRLREYPERSAPLLSLMWPYMLVFALLITHVIRYHRIVGGSGVLVLDALVAIGAVALVRQLVVTHRHRTRVESQRSELVASVSHELRTPLTAIVGYLALLEESDEYLSKEARREMLADANGQARHMARLVSDLVLLARGFDGQVPLEITETTISGLVTDALGGVPTGGKTIEAEVDDDSLVRLDGDRIRQAVVNMLTNAIRYGGRRILVRAEVRHERTLVIEVHDDGSGVPTRFENMIWQRFERGANRLDSASPGMGIGLAIVRAVAESHGGAASYRRSELLGGACFSLTIPGCVAGRPVRLRV